MSAVLDELTDLIVVEGLDFDPLCESVSHIVPPFGEHVAHFSIQCRRCGVIVLICRAHIDWIVLQLVHPRYRVACDTCHASAGELTEMFEVRPL